MSAKGTDTSEQFVVVDGFNVPGGDRYDPGDHVKAADLPKKSLPWLVKDHHIAPLTSIASAGAIELAAKNGIRLSDVEGKGKDGQITKPDVEAAIKAKVGS